MTPSPRIAIAVLLAGCSGSPARDDAGADAAGGADAAIDASARCDVTKPFSAPVRIDGVDTTDDERPGWQSRDGRRLYFARAAAGSNGFDLLVATRADSTGAFTATTALALDTIYAEKHPALMPDELTLYLELTNSASNADIAVATRATVDDDFGAYAPLAGFDTAQNDFNPWITADGLALYFTSDRDGFNDLFVATRAAVGDPFGTPAPLAELNTSYGDYMGAVRGDGLEIVFASTRDTNGANSDIFHATRAAVSEPFGPPAKLVEVSDATANEAPSWVSEDGCELMFMSNRGGPDYDIWVAARPR